MSRALKISIALNIALAAVCTFLLVWNLQQTAPVVFADAPRPAAAGSHERDLPDSSSAQQSEVKALSSASVSSLPPPSSDGRDRPIAPASPASSHTATPGLAGYMPSSASTLANGSPADTTTGLNVAAVTPGEAVTSQNTAPSTPANTAAVASFTRPVYPAIYAHNASVAAIDAGVTRPGSRSPDKTVTGASERAIADQITQKFVEAVGPTPQDPNDPEYRQRWDAAVQMSDKMYADHFGARALQKRQIDAAVQLAQQQAAMAK